MDRKQKKVAFTTFPLQFLIVYPYLISLVKGEDAGKEYSQTVHVHVGVVPKLIVADYTTVSFKLVWKDLSQLTKD